MEEFTTFVSSRGVLKGCCARNQRPTSSSAEIDADLLTRHRAGGSIYVCTDALPEFATTWLPRVTTPFTLVTGDSDAAVSPSSLGEAVFLGILENDLCQAWFAQNLAARHAKLFGLPIGLDYHTMWEKPGLWGITQISPFAQERLLLETWARSPQVPQRYLGAYCNWTGSLERGDRRICLQQIDPTLAFIERPGIARASSWSRQAEFLFVVSPAGAGIDCHRTWEALLLGCIPIVKRSIFSELLARLPVLIVDDWGEVRRATLESFVSDLGRKTFDYSILFRETWMRRIHRLPPAAPLELSYEEFRRVVTLTTA